MPISSSSVFCTTKSTVMPVRSSNSSIATGYTRFLCSADELLCLSNVFRSVSKSFSLSNSFSDSFALPLILLIWYKSCNVEQSRVGSKSIVVTFLNSMLMFVLANFRFTLASSMLKAWYSSFTSRSKFGFTKTWPTRPNSLTNPRGVHTVIVKGKFSRNFKKYVCRYMYVENYAARIIICGMFQ